MNDECMALKKEGVQFHNSPRFCHFFDTKSGQPRLDSIISFTKHENWKYFHVCMSIIMSFFYTVVQVMMFIHQEKKTSLKTSHFAM